MKAKKQPNPLYSPLTAAGLFKEAFQVSISERGLDVRVYYTPAIGSSGTVMVCHHGAGYSGLSFAMFAKEVTEMTKGECGVLALDARRHGNLLSLTRTVFIFSLNNRSITGKTTSIGSDDGDLSIQVLVADFCALIQSVFPDSKSAPSLLVRTPIAICSESHLTIWTHSQLVGHSMGGSIMTRSCPILIERGYRVAGVSVLDVVEGSQPILPSWIPSRLLKLTIGSAVDALPHMHNLLNARPDGFDSMEEAIEWQSVVFSYDSYLFALCSMQCSVTTHTIQNAASARVSIPSIIKHVEGGLPPYQWRTPLRSTAPYWLSWFQGLSQCFLSARSARLLILAGTDRLDKELMIGQMQGKFQMEVVPNVGHMLHEVRIHKPTIEL